jgi:riboflavin synthase
MFTGLVQAMGTVTGVEPLGTATRVAIDLGSWHHRPAVGDSIAIDGCCLTVAEIAGSVACFDAVRETLGLTTLGGVRVGDRVHLEHALRADGLMGGHMVQGHVDGVGVVAEVRAEAGDWRVEVQPPAALMEYMVPKGSVTIAGVSLTIARVTRDTVGVALIPTTLEKTTLGGLRAGDRVNIEADVVAKTVVHWMRNFREAGRLEG